MTSSEPKTVSSERISLLLDALTLKKIPQRVVASQLQIPNQYLTDYKCGRRRLNQEIARKFETAFGEAWKVTAGWLLGESDEGPTIFDKSAAGSKASKGVGAFQLPVFFHPIEGDPDDHPRGTGFMVDIFGAAKHKLQLARLPYVLQFGATDRENRIHTGDWLLMSQAPPLETAGIHSTIQVIRHARGLYLARRVKEGWQRLAKECPTIPLKDCTVHGHALAILYGDLT